MTFDQELWTPEADWTQNQICPTELSYTNNNITTPGVKEHVEELQRLSGQ